MTSVNGLHVVFGTGPVGLAVVRELSSRGVRVRASNRSGSADVPDGVEMVAADAGEPAQATRAAEGAAVVYHCANPPYATWPETHPPLMAGIIEGAATARARLVFADNLYAYGPVDGPLSENLPSRASGPNGRVRAEIADTLMEADRSDRVRAAIARASDFFGPHALLSQMGERVFANALHGKPAQYLGKPDLPHTFTYVEDFARALVILGEREEALGQVWHVPNAPTVPVNDFVGAVFEEAGHPFELRVPPRAALRLIGLFNPTVRALKEQFYQLDAPWVVDHGKFERAFGDIATPMTAAIRRTLDWFRGR